MRLGKLPLVLALPAAAIVLAAAGCGGKKESASTSVSTATTTTTAQASTPTATTPAAAASALAGLAALANCPQLVKLESSILQALQGSGGDLQKQIPLIERYAAQTPPAVRADFQTLASALADAASSLKGVDLGSGQAPNSAALAKILNALSGPKVVAAEQHISAWAAKNCHG